jgi:outer membrane biosynthesis protein TonB
MFIWFAQRASLTSGMIRILLVMVVVMMLAQILSKQRALAAPTDPQQSTSQTQEVQQPSTPPPAVEEETKPTAPPVVEDTPEAPSGKPEEELQKPETTLAVIDESTADKEQGGKALENQKPDEEAANQQKADEETDKQGQTTDQKNAGQNQGQDAEDQKTKADEDAGALNQQLTPNDKKNDHDYEHYYKDDYPEYCEYPSFAYDPACDENNYHDDDPDFEKDWYKPYYWKAVVVHDCYCWADYAKPWYYWNHWDYYYWDYYYSPATIYHSFYGYCYHYYYVAYFKVFGEDKKHDPVEEDRLRDPGIRLCDILPTDCEDTADAQSSTV